MAYRVLFVFIFASVSVKADDLGMYCFKQNEFESNFSIDQYSDIKKVIDQTKEKDYDYISIINISYRAFDEGIASLKLYQPNKSAQPTGRILKQIKNLKLFEKHKIVPKFHACLNLNDKTYAIIHQRVYLPLSNEDMIDSFRSLYPFEKIHMVLRIAVMIKILHNKGVNYNFISSDKIMSTESDLTDLRLIDFSLASDEKEQIKSDSIESLTLHFLTYNEKKSDASFDRDTFSFVMVMLELLEPTGQRFDDILDITDNINLFINTFRKYLDGIDKDYQLKDLSTYFDDLLLKYTEKLTIDNVILKLIDIYLILINNKNRLRIIENLEKQYKFDLEEFKKIVII